MAPQPSRVKRTETAVTGRPNVSLTEHVSVWTVTRHVVSFHVLL